MHAYDQLRDVILSRLKHQTATIGSIAWAANISASHLVNFVRYRKDLGPQAFARVCAAVGFDAELVPQPGTLRRLPPPPPPKVRREQRPPKAPRAKRSAPRAAGVEERAKSHKKP